MFDKGQDRYITRGIKHKLNPKLQVILWQMIEEASNKTELDYLQIFKLSKYIKEGKPLQKIVHIQEQPEYQRTIYVPAPEVVSNEKIYVIDDESHSTMLLAREY